nr:hypothetical protein [uncultured Celeribacter sp.]
MTQGPKSDTEIDRIVDELVSDEKTAQALKEQLHEAMPEPRLKAVSASVTDEDDDDIWDNIPI